MSMTSKPNPAIKPRLARAIFKYNNNNETVEDIRAEDKDAD